MWLETSNDFMTKVMKVVTQIRLLGEQFLDNRIIEQFLVVLRERFESQTFSIEEPKGLSKFCALLSFICVTVWCRVTILHTFFLIVVFLAVLVSILRVSLLSCKPTMTATTTTTI
jgi:hypothetical protein